MCGSMHDFSVLLKLKGRNHSSYDTRRPDQSKLPPTFYWKTPLLPRNSCLQELKTPDLLEMTTLLQNKVPCVYAQGQACECLSGPYLHTATLRQWGATIISHRKLNDDHIQLMIAGRASPGSVDDTPSLVFVSNDKISIRLPNSPDGDDNFVVGLAMDTSVDAVS